MVPVDGRRASVGLIRVAARLAATRGASWVAVYQDASQRQLYTRLEERRLAANLRLVEQLGGDLVCFLPASRQLGRELVTLARAQEVTHLVVDRAGWRGWVDRLKGPILEALKGDPSLVLEEVLPDPGRREPAPRAWSEPWDLRSLALVVAMVAVATALGFLVYNTLGQADVIMLYMLTITVAATQFGRWTTLVAAALSILAFDFCFIDPRFTFVVTDFQHVGTFAMMLGMGWVLLGLAERIRAQTRLAQERERHTRVLYRVGKVLAEGGSPATLQQRVEAFLRRELNVPVALLLCDSKGELPARSGNVELAPDDFRMARAAMDLGVPMGQGTESLPRSRCLILPMPGTEKPVGVLALMTPDGAEPPSDQLSLLLPLASQVSLALERASIAEERTQARIRAEHEQLRSTLLSSISHDLRTPLGSITGATTTLLDPGPAAAPGDQKVLLNTIHHESRRLLRMVNNLLDITKLESGQVKVRREWVAAEEVVGSALSHVEEQLGSRPVSVDLPEAWVHLDPLLLEQALVNLLDNAAKFSPPGTGIDIRGRVADGAFELQVADRGPGIAPGEEELIFEKLYRGSGGGTAPGAGLGLAICRAIVQAHAGWITARNRPGGGTLVALALPMGIPAPEGLPPDLNLDPSHELPGAVHEP
jgi:two-component system sensor histidine kinase KdpD